MLTNEHNHAAKDIGVTYVYDNLNRQTVAQFPDPAQNITYTYDGGTYGKGHLTRNNGVWP